MAGASAPGRHQALRSTAGLIAAGVLLGALALPLGRVLAQTGDPVLLNELLVSQTGVDTTEFFELYGTPGHSLAGLSIVSVDGDGATAGTIDVRIDLSSDAVLGGNGFYLVGNPTGLAATYGVTPDLSLASNDVVPNGSQTVALVATASIGAGGSVVTGSEDVRDAVGLSDGGYSDHWFWGAPVVGPDADGFAAPGASRLADGVDTDTAADWQLASYYPGTSSDTNTPTAGTPYVPPATPTPTPTPTLAPTPTPTPADDPTPVAQPVGSVSALVDALDACVAAGAVDGSKAHQLHDRLARVERFLADGHASAAAAQLRAFGNQVQGFAPRWIDQADADSLSQAAAALAASL
jgi:hypothetical protein